MPPRSHVPRSAGGWFLQGVLHLPSIPAAVLLTAHVGYAAIAREAGLSLGQTLALSLSVWALPGQLVFLGLVASASLPAIALAVSLSAVRLMPMVMAWAPVVRAPQTRTWTLYALCWAVAVTSWVFAMSKLPTFPREARLPFFAGFALTLTAATVPVTTLSYMLVAELPDAAAASLVFLTPMYFILALWGAASLPADRLALGLGLLIGPPCTLLLPELDLVVAGLLGGTIAFVLTRRRRGRRARPSGESIAESGAAEEAARSTQGPPPETAATEQHPHG